MAGTARENVLQAMAACYRKMMDDLFDGMLLMDVDSGKILGVNKAFVKMTGLTEPEALADLREAFLDPIDFYMLQGCGQTRAYDMEMPVLETRIEHVDGALRDVEIRPSLMESDGCRLLQLLFRDTSEMKRLENHFRHSHVMNTVGQVTGGVGHDLRNTLGVIRLATDLLEAEEESLDEMARQAVRMIAGSTERGEHLCGRLQALGNRCNSRSSVMDLHEMIDDTLFMLPYTLKSRVEVSLVPLAEEHLVFGDAVKVQSALMNLCINADKAMPDGGTLRIETRNVHLTKTNAKVGRFDLAPGMYLQIIVEDTGCGMEPEVLEKVLDPYFSTEHGDDNRGEGLGLTLVSRIMQDHHGAVALTSQAGEGTSASLFLPLEAGAMGGQKAVHQVGEGDDTILLCI